MFPRIPSILLVFITFTVTVSALTTVTVGAVPSFSGTLRSYMPKTIGVTLHPTPTSTPIPASQCSVGNLQCCHSTAMSDTTAVADMLNLFVIVLQGVTALAGLTCSPISAGDECTTQPVCCQDNFHGVVAFGCVPVTLDV